MEQCQGNLKKLPWWGNMLYAPTNELDLRTSPYYNLREWGVILELLLTCLWLHQSSFELDWVELYLWDTQLIDKLTDVNTLVIIDSITRIFHWGLDVKMNWLRLIKWPASLLFIIVLVQGPTQPSRPQYSGKLINFVSSCMVSHLWQIRPPFPPTLLTAFHVDQIKKSGMMLSGSVLRQNSRLDSC